MHGSQDTANGFVLLQHLRSEARSGLSLFVRLVLVVITGECLVGNDGTLNYNQESSRKALKGAKRSKDTPAYDSSSQR